MCLGQAICFRNIQIPFSGTVPGIFNVIVDSKKSIYGRKTLNKGMLPRPLFKGQTKSSRSLSDPYNFHNPVQRQCDRQLSAFESSVLDPDPDRIRI